MKSTLLKLLAMALVVCMLIPAFAACTPAEPGDSETAGDSETTGGSEAQTEPAKGYEDDGKTYSYRMAPSDLPESWNYHTYQSNASTYVLDYSSDTLYTFDYKDDNFDSYKIVPSMAAADPVDVTSKYVGKYGIVAGDVNKAWQIKLKNNLKFDNGEKLDANSFVTSMKWLLNPEAANFRADNVYQSGDLKIYNADTYVKQNSYALSEFVSANYGDDEYVDPADFVAGENGVLTYEGKDIVLDMTSGGNWGSTGLLGYAANIAGYVYNEDETKLALANAAGEIVAWRTVTKQEVGEETKYLFYDLDGEPVEIGLNEDKTMYVYNDEEIDFAIDWDACPDLKALKEAADEKGWVKLTAATLLNLQNCIAILHGCDDVAAYAAEAGDYAYQEFEEMAFFGIQYGSLDWEEVGFFAEDDLTLVVVLKNPMEKNFYLMYELCTSFFLVYSPLYEECITTDGGVYANTYATSIDTYVGYGPYKLTSYVEGAQIILERNPYWHGYQAGEYVEGTYQTDRIVYNKVTENATRLEMFLKGQIDSYGLQPEDMADYIGSDYTYFNDSESTWYLAMNPQLENLTATQAAATPATEGNKVYKTVLTIDEFRWALSYSLDRTAFNQLLSPTSGVAKALLSSMIIADPDAGYSYRSMDEAKDAILEFWGLSDDWGEGKEYADRDEAIDSITGFDPAGAKTLFTTAYNKAVEAGLIDAEDITSGKWEVQICIGKPSDAKYYNDGYTFLASCWTDAVAGTPFEGHMSFVQSQTLGSTTFGSYLRNGSVDILFGVGYGGSMFNPFSMMDCFTGSLQYDPFTDKTAIMLDVTFKADDELVGGKTLRASLYDWVSVCLMGDEIEAIVVVNGEATDEKINVSAGTSDPSARRITILAAAETKIMTIGNIFPIQTDASASLRCMRLNYKTEEYILGMGRGGVQYFTYTMDDAEFVAYAESQTGGVLNYK